MIAALSPVLNPPSVLAVTGVAVGPGVASADVLLLLINVVDKIVDEVREEMVDNIIDEAVNEAVDETVAGGGMP